ncbi:uncharacterized protein A4U43_C04F13460 [Asparagus officinalis]|uniref:Uncharacterized protein n=1 Tax=Asparagus officinalis TaxID=4686 RepID=A0A5P1F2E1_ASPOF|nr:uncharacterized protein At3g27210-like isoform X2 [Asparagus officinalis]ONK71893.1 uncharacterized protein A4U43_C04F13460 [Asparagus officinalis]
MGSCSSVHKSKKPQMTASSPHKEKPLNGESAVKVVGSHLSMRSSFGSKDETFFDSRAWLDSDCEDDFFSVNGDFTPSRGSTSYSSPTTLSGANSDKFTDSNSEPSPTGRKKLSDLFQETPKPNASNEKPEAGREGEFSNQTKPEQPLDRANPVRNNELATPSRDDRKKGGEKSAQCCLPSFGQSFSLGERRQKSPVQCSA